MLITDIIELQRPLVVIDAEMTGTAVEVDRIIQLGLIIIKPNGEMMEWKTYINPGMPIPPESTVVHHITDEMVADAPSFAFCAERLKALLEGSDVAGFNVTFDLDFIVAELKRLRIEFKFENYILDASKIFFMLNPRTLVAARKEYLGETATDDAHDALVDAQASLRVLIAQLERHVELPRTAEALHKLCFETARRDDHLDSEGKLAWRNNECIINFGKKWKGVPLNKVDRSYLIWITNSQFREDVKTIIGQALLGVYPVKEQV